MTSEFEGIEFQITKRVWLNAEQMSSVEPEPYITRDNRGVQIDVVPESGSLRFEWDVVNAKWMLAGGTLWWNRLKKDGTPYQNAIRQSLWNELSSQRADDAGLAALVDDVRPSARVVLNVDGVVSR